MGDLENLAALKRMLEKKDEEEAQNNMNKEKKFIADATKACIGEDSEVSSIHGYDPETMIKFLELPSKEIQSKMGGEWQDMDLMAFEAFTYTIKQKIQKSDTLIDWKS